MDTHGILLITEQGESRWPVLVRKAASRLGRTLDVAGSLQLYSFRSWNNLALVIIDACHIKGLQELVKTIREQRPDLFIIIVSPAPGYEDAKDAIRAHSGMRYELKPTNYHDILHLLEQGLMNSFG